MPEPIETPTVNRALTDPVTVAAALAAGKKVPPDATLILIQDHLEAMSYFDWYEEEADATARAGVAWRLWVALSVHMDVEEKLFYPAAAEATGDKEMIDRAYAEHAAAKKILNDIGAALNGQGELADPLMTSLRVAIEEHVIEEESELFPEVRETGLDLYTLGAKMAVLRVERLLEITGRGTMLSDPATGKGPAKASSQTKGRAKKKSK
jgi:hypothetical protein